MLILDNITEDMPRKAAVQPEYLNDASSILRTLGNKHRLHILSLLVQREHRVGELEKLVGLSQSALSQHLARLRRDGIVATRREAQTIHYSLSSKEAGVLLDILNRLFQDSSAINT